MASDLKTIIIFCLNFQVIYCLTIAKCSRNDISRSLIRTTTGYIKGYCENVKIYDENVMRDSNVYTWLGIPYAESKRFETPMRVQYWNHIRDCTRPSNTCFQIHNTRKQNMFDGYKMFKTNENISNFSEDCLQLNIWAPAKALLRARNKTAKVPIMVFMNDFDLTKGSSMLDIYDPSVFVALSQIIVITLNYRLGVYGFLHINGHISGNQGILDQHFALKWIHANALNFGGDSSKITLVGSSSVSYHLFYKQSWPFYTNVILQSGSPFKTNLHPIDSTEATYRGMKFAEFVNCSNSKISKTISCLKSLNPIELVEAEENFLNSLLNMNDITGANLITFFPFVIDGQIVREIPENSFQRNNFKNCSILIGFNLNEGSSILDRSERQKPNKNKSFNLPKLYNFLEQHYYYYPNYPIRTSKTFIKKIVDEYNQFNLNKQHENFNYFRILEKILTHESYVCDSLRLAKEYSIFNKAYVYLYSHRISSSPWIPEYGTVHRDELAMLFGHIISLRQSNSTISYNPWLLSNRVYSKSERTLCYQIINYWSNFIKNENPNLKSDVDLEKLADWPLFDHQNSNSSKIINLKEPYLQVINNFAHEKCKFWDRIKSEIFE
jgi:carboxylesterase type B